MELNHVQKQFKTGDLLAVSYASTRGKLVKIFTGSMWTHLGMVYKTKDDSLYVLESAHYPDSSGVLKTPFYKWISWNDDRTIAWASLVGTPIMCDDIERIYQKIQKGKVDLFVFNWLLTTIRLPYISGYRGKFFCSELIAYLLQELGILEKLYSPSSYSPKELLYGKVNYVSSYHYLNPILLTLTNI